MDGYGDVSRDVVVVEGMDKLRDSVFGLVPELVNRGVKGLHKLEQKIGGGELFLERRRSRLDDTFR